MVCITLSKTVSRSGLYGRGFFVIIFILGRRLSYVGSAPFPSRCVYTLLPCEIISPASSRPLAFVFARDTKACACGFSLLNSDCARGARCSRANDIIAGETQGGALQNLRRLLPVSCRCADGILTTYTLLMTVGK